MSKSAAGGLRGCNGAEPLAKRAVIRRPADGAWLACSKTQRSFILPIWLRECEHELTLKSERQSTVDLQTLRTFVLALLFRRLAHGTRHV